MWIARFASFCWLHWYRGHFAARCSGLVIGAAVPKSDDSILQQLRVCVAQWTIQGLGRRHKIGCRIFCVLYRNKVVPEGRICQYDLIRYISFF